MCISNLHTWVLHNDLKISKHTYIGTNMHSYIRTFILYTCIIAYIHHCLFAFLIFCLILLVTYLLLYVPFHSYFFPCLLSWCSASLLTSMIHCFTSLVLIFIPKNFIMKYHDKINSNHLLLSLFGAWEILSFV